MICSYLLGKTKTNVAYQKKVPNAKRTTKESLAHKLANFIKKSVCLMCGQVNFLFYPWLMNFVLTFILCDSSWSILNFGLCTLFFYCTPLESDQRAETPKERHTYYRYIPFSFNRRDRLVFTQLHKCQSNFLAAHRALRIFLYYVVKG